MEKKDTKPKGSCKACALCKKVNKKIVWMVVSSLVVLVCFFGVIGLGAIQLGWDNKVSNAMVSFFPYPAAIVDGDIIKYSDWKFETEAVLLLSEKRLNDYSVEGVKNEVLQKMIYDELMKDIAEKYNIEVTDEDMDLMMASLVEQVGSPEELETNIKEFFGWGVETFKERVLYSDVLREKLSKEIPLNEKNLKEAEEKAEDVLKEVEAGKKTFEELAQANSEDPGSATQGGDLGWFPRGVMVSEFEEAVFALNPGEVSGLIKTDFGYHIIKLEEKKTVEDEADGQEQVKARHILIKTKSFDDYLAELEESAKIWKFVALDQE